MLTYGLLDWRGPLTCTDALARAMGFGGVDDLESEADRIGTSIYEGTALTARDWTRALIATQIAFAIHREWGPIHGGTDAKWIGVLPRPPRKVPTSSSHLPG